MSGNSKKRIQDSSRLPLLLLLLFFWVPVALNTALVVLQGPSIWGLAGLALLTVVGYVSKKFVENSLKQGFGLQGATYFFDLFALNSLVAITSLAWSTAWYLYLLVPGYLLYQLFKYLFNQVAEPIQPQEASPSPATEQKQRKRRVKYVKH